MRFEVEGYGPPDSAALTAAGMSAAFASDSDHFVAASGRLLTAHRKGAEWIRRTPEAGYDRCMYVCGRARMAGFFRSETYRLHKPSRFRFLLFG